MTKEVEVGDEFKGKVVKTTTFGAFVELAKGTDGLLHISNVSPGNRVGDGRGGAQQGRRDRRPRGRGRQGARPHRPAPRRGPGHRRQDRRGARHRRHRRPDDGRRRRQRPRPRPAPRRPRRRRRRRPRRARPRPRPAWRDRDRAPARRPRPRPHGNRHCPTIASRSSTPGCGSSRRHMPSVRSAALGFFVGTGSRGETEAEAGLSHFLEHLLFRGTDALRARRRSTSSSTAWAPSSTPAPTRRAPRSTRGCSTSTCRRRST